VHELAERDRALDFDLLLTAESLLALGRDPRWFDKPAQLGVTTVLRTWARDLCTCGSVPGQAAQLIEIDVAAGQDQGDARARGEVDQAME
jgi:hypothetical protein